MAANDENLLTYDRLTAEQRATAWAVVRGIATALWVGLTAVVVAAFYLVVNRPDLAPVSVLPLAGTLGLALAMEIQSRSLEKVEP